VIPASEVDLVSIVVPARNAEPWIAKLLDSLLAQAPPVEIVVAEAGSRDRTREIAARYAARHRNVLLVQGGETAGASRNAALEGASGALVAFIDADCRADRGWTPALRHAVGAADVVIGKTVMIGPRPFAALRRVEMWCGDHEVTAPACNLLYRRALLRTLGGFDPALRTAEDIDLNLRALAAGARMVVAEDAVVYSRARDTAAGFALQAWFNGVGRRQLALKHGSLWHRYRLGAVLRGQCTGWAILRLAIGAAGYAWSALAAARGVSPPGRPSRPSPRPAPR